VLRDQTHANIVRKLQVAYLYCADLAKLLALFRTDSFVAEYTPEMLKHYAHHSESDSQPAGQCNADEPDLVAGEHRAADSTSSSTKIPSNSA
jgi:hypothetical protein